MMNFDFLLHIELEKLINKSSFKVEGRISNDLRLAGYLYVRATHSWSVINEELGLRSNFDEGIGQHLLAMWLFRAKDAAMCEIAFSESEAMAFVAKKTKSSEFKTIEMETAEYREILGLKRVQIKNVPCAIFWGSARTAVLIELMQSQPESAFRARADRTSRAYHQESAG